MNIESIFPKFGEFLDERLTKQVFTTEDSIRYTFFYCLTQYFSLKHTEIILEYPHPKIKGAEIDTFIKTDTGNSQVFEFKYDRSIPSERNIPKTMKAGKLFADIFRLSLYKQAYPEAKCFFIYVTDREMAVYFRNDDNNLVDFFDKTNENTLTIDENYIKKHPNTFVKNAGGIITTKIRLVTKIDFKSNNYLRIYEIV
ncbi:MAG: hypothetical protein EB170_07460 [Nitrosopumilaceae archaeon]|nr:hypothetical protein [Nitrosopumilaceae archaeon]NDF25401.1 hypothetical protein [Nitrososphaerota archaeon]NDF35983.1 hypothetical protein [Nitrosopumilaceae archaeon]